MLAVLGVVTAATSIQQMAILADAAKDVPADISVPALTAPPFLLIIGKFGLRVLLICLHVFTCLMVLRLSAFSRLLILAALGANLFWYLLFGIQIAMGPVDASELYIQIILRSCAAIVYGCMAFRYLEGMRRAGVIS